METPDFTQIIERENPGYTVDRYTAEILIDTPGDGQVYRLTDIYLTGIHSLSDDGRIDSQPLPKVIAPKNHPMGDLMGWLVRTRNPISDVDTRERGEKK